MTMSKEENENCLNKIELTLILQLHKLDKELEEKSACNEEDKEKIIFSQLKIMQMLASDEKCRNSIILAEGNDYLVTPDERDSKVTNMFKRIFSEYGNLQTLDYNHLSHNQRAVLYNNQALTILYHLKSIDFVYPTKDKDWEDLKFLYTYVNAYKKNLLEYPNLLQKCQIFDSSESLELSCITAKDQLAYQEFIDKSRRDAPAIFYYREKKALDYVVEACNLTNNKKAVLLFGKDHLNGIKKLIETEYKDKIVLSKIIDTAIGCPTKSNQTWLDKINKEAISCYSKKNFEEAIVNFKNITQFWHAAPSTTPRRDESLLIAAFNLGSALLLLSDRDLNKLEDAVNHLKLANDIATSRGEKKDNKYDKRYNEALTKLTEIKKQSLNFLQPDSIHNSNPLNLYKAAVKDIKEKNYNLAINKLDQAFLEFEKKKGKDSEECLNCYSSLISCYRDLENYSKAIQQAEAVIEFYYGKKNIDAVIKKYYELLKSRQDKPNLIYAQAIQDYKNKYYQLALYKLLFIISHHNDCLTPQETATYYSTISSCYRELKMYDLAEKYCDQALVLRRQFFKLDDKLVIDLEHKLEGIISLRNNSNTPGIRF